MEFVIPIRNSRLLLELPPMPFSKNAQFVRQAGSCLNAHASGTAVIGLLVHG